jgi:hypothetical protein
MLGTKVITAIYLSEAVLVVVIGIVLGIALQLS